MSGKLKFDQQIKLIEKKFGKSNADEIYKIYAATTEWLLKVGHGSAELNAIQH